MLCLPPNQPVGGAGGSGRGKGGGAGGSGRGKGGGAGGSGWRCVCVCVWVCVRCTSDFQEMVMASLMQVASIWRLTSSWS